MEENSKITIGGNGNNDIPSEFIDKEFEVPTESVKLPSKGVFYTNKKDSVIVKFLTAEEEDILFSPELIKSGKVLDVLLQKAIVDKDIDPSDMLTGDRNAVLIHLRKNGIGEMYQPGKMICPVCGESHEPTVDLNKLKLKWLEVMPDENGLYDFELPTMKKIIKFRLLNGHDENRIAKSMTSVVKGHGKQRYKISNSITDRYKMQIVEFDGKKDIYISKLVSAMPMRDSLAFREYIKIVSPGIDLNYVFECPHCGNIYEEEVPMTYKLFYPNAEF